MPGWREDGFWQYENEELDEIGQRSSAASSTARRSATRSTDDDRDGARRVGPRLAGHREQQLPRGEGIEGETATSSRARGTLVLREASVPGSDEIRVGHLWVWTERTTWNPVGGFGDVYSVDICRNLVDPPIINHPFTGIPKPFRASYEVETAGPDGTLEVPADAVLWDAEADAWAPVDGRDDRGEQGHLRLLPVLRHELAPRPADHAGRRGVLDRAGLRARLRPEKARIETALAVTSRPYLETFKGFRIVDDDTLEVYVDYWHFDEDYIASYATPAGFDMPWEVLAAMDDVVFEQAPGRLQRHRRARFSVPWLSLVHRRDARLVDRALREFGREPSVPTGVFEVGGRTLVTPEGGRGPLRGRRSSGSTTTTTSSSATARSSSRLRPARPVRRARRLPRPDLPVQAGRPLPRRAAATLSVDDVTADPVVAGEDAVVTATVRDPARSGCSTCCSTRRRRGRDLGLGGAGRGAGTFSVTIPADVTGALFPGFYELYLAATSDALAQVSERRVDLEVAP